jgi:hypothetical protein
MTMQDNKNSGEEQVSFLMGALDEAQSTVRAFDTKAQIVGIGYIFAVGIITTIASWNPDKTPFTITSVVLAWFFVIIPIVFFASVLYPSRKMAPKLGEKSSHVKRLYHVSTEYIKNVDSYLSDIEDCDIRAELSYELMKVSALRELKRIRFLRALFVSSMSFVAIFLLQLLRSAGIELF